MLIAIVRGMLMIALLALFLKVGDGFLMLACAMCAGAIMGSEMRDGQWLGISIFYVTICFLFGGFCAKAAAMAAFFFPDMAAQLDGFAIFLMAVAIGGYACWEAMRTADCIEEKREMAL